MFLPFVLHLLQSLGTNHPSLDYANEQLLSLLHSQTRDDVIYALKQCAKRGYSLEPRYVPLEFSKVVVLGCCFAQWLNATGVGLDGTILSILYTALQQYNGGDNFWAGCISLGSC